MYRIDDTDKDVAYELDLIDKLCDNGAITTEEARYLRSTMY